MNLHAQLEKCNEGVFHLTGGEVAWTYCIQEGNEWFMRYESGWYVEIFDDGKRGSPGDIVSKDGLRVALDPGDQRDVKLFEPMGYAVALSKYPNLQVGFPP